MPDSNNCFEKNFRRASSYFTKGDKKGLSEEETGIKWQRDEVWEWASGTSQGSIFQADRKASIEAPGQGCESKMAREECRRESGRRQGQRGMGAELVGPWHFQFDGVKCKATEGFLSRKVTWSDLHFKWGGGRREGAEWTKADQWGAPTSNPNKRCWGQGRQRQWWPEVAGLASAHPVASPFTRAPLS